MPAVQSAEARQHIKKGGGRMQPAPHQLVFLWFPSVPINRKHSRFFHISFYIVVVFLSTCNFHVSLWPVYLKIVFLLYALFSRSSLLRSLLQPESVRLDWLCLAVSHDAPQRANTVDAEGNPR